MSGSTIWGTTEFAWRSAALPLVCFLGFWAFAQFSFGKPESRGRRSRSLLWMAGIFLLVAGIQPWRSNRAAQVMGNYESCVWLADSIGLCMLAMRLGRRIIVSGIVIILIATTLLIGFAWEWARYW